MEIKTSDLGLAAYLKKQNCLLIRKEGKKEIIFESEKTLNNWEIEYMNSCCKKHDTEVMILRKFLNSE